MAELEVNLSADVKELRRQLAQAKKELQKYGNVADNVTSGTAKSYQRSTSSISKSNRNLNQSNKKTSAGAVELGRALGDLPFGIQGIANNIQQLAFVMGAGAGLQIAISGVTALLVVLEKRGINLSSVFNNLSKTTIEYAKATREVVSPVKAEITELRTLVKIANDSAIATSARQRAIDRLNDEYGDYLGNLDLESIKTKDVRKQIDNLTDSLLKNAQARSSQNLIQSIFNDRQEELIKLTQRQRNAAKAVSNEVKRLTDDVAAFSRVDTSRPLTEQIRQIQNIIDAYGGQGSSLVRLLDNNLKEYNRAVRDTKAYSDETKKALEPVLNLFEQLTIKDLVSGIDNAAPEIVLTPRASVSNISGGVGNKFLEDVFKITDSAQKSLQQGFNNAPFRTGFFEILETPLANGLKNIEPGLSAIQQRYARFTKEMEGLTVNLSGAITTGFSALGQALANGENLFGAVGQAILQTMGQIATELGRASIAAGIAALSLKNLFKSPAAAIAAGGALVAIGSALSSARGAVGSIGTSNVAGQGSRSLPGSSITSTPTNGLEGVSIEIRGKGTELIGVINNTLAANGRSGGDLLLG
ncbi:MAG: hypothetical protein AAF554_18620 [Bacteroidota bacterium]